MNRAQRRADARAQKANAHAARLVARAHGAARALDPLLMCSPFTEEQAATICNIPRLAWLRMTTGAGDETDFDVVADVCNVMLVVAEPLGADLVAEILAAQTALLTIRDRHASTGSWSPSAPGLLAVNNLLDRYAEAVAVSTAQQMTEAKREADRRVRARMIQTLENNT